MLTPSLISSITCCSIYSCLCCPVSIIASAYTCYLSLNFAHNLFRT
jgi:hypothetical protein